MHRFASCWRPLAIRSRRFRRRGGTRAAAPAPPGCGRSGSPDVGSGWLDPPAHLPRGVSARQPAGGGHVGAGGRRRDGRRPRCPMLFEQAIRRAPARRGARGRQAGPRLRPAAAQCLRRQGPDSRGARVHAGAPGGLLEAVPPLLEVPGGRFPGASPGWDLERHLSGPIGVHAAEARGWVATGLAHLRRRSALEALGPSGYCSGVRTLAAHAGHSGPSMSQVNLNPPGRRRTGTHCSGQHQLHHLGGGHCRR